MSNQTATSIFAPIAVDLQRCADGGWRSPLYDDVYFQRNCALDESRYVFLEKNRLYDRLAAHHALNDARAVFTVGELGFGTGLNMLLVIDLWRGLFEKSGPSHSRLHFLSFEKHPVTRDSLARVYDEWPALETSSRWLLANYPPLCGGLHHLHDDTLNLRLTLALGDVGQYLPDVGGENIIDAWFLDGFAPLKNPAMWQDDLYPHLFRLSRACGTLSSFTVVGHVRRALKTAGYSVEKTKGFGFKWSMTTAQKPETAPAAAHKALRVAVIGAGIAGASVARALALRGCDVSVFDRHGEIAAEASGNPRAIVYPKPTADDAPSGRLSVMSFCFAEGLYHTLPSNIWQQTGVLRLMLDAQKIQRGQKITAFHQYPDALCSWQAKTAFNHPALLHASGGMIDTVALCKYWLTHPRITLNLNHVITDIPVAGFDATVVASANAALHFTGLANLPLHPLRGQVSCLKPTAVSQNLRQVICHEGYLTPVVNGWHHAGATFQKEAPSKAGDHTDTARAQDNLENLATLNSHLQGLGFGPDHLGPGRARYRATTPDKLPIAGPSNIECVYLCCGFGAHGFTTAPLAADMLAADITGELPPLPASLVKRLSPKRFDKK